MPAAGVVGEAMVMLTLAGFVLEKFGGDSIDDVRASARPLPGADRDGARGARSPAAGARPRPADAHGLTGTDEAGSGGDD